MIRKQLRHWLLAVLFTPALLTACKKTETIAPPALPSAQILEFTITNVPETEQVIRASINQESGGLTLYLPAYLQLPVLMPAIKVTDGATVTPASGTQINDLLKKVRKKEMISYSVKGKDGVVKEYSLNIVVQQPKAMINELSTDANNPLTFTLEAGPDAYFDINFTGENFVVDNREEMMSVVLIDATGRELPELPGGGSHHNYATHKEFRAQVIRSQTNYSSQLSADGLYKVRVYNYGSTIDLKNPIRIIKK